MPSRVTQKLVHDTEAALRRALREEVGRSCSGCRMWDSTHLI